MVFLIHVIVFSPAICTAPENTGQSPNVLIILTDDLGYGDISAYRSETVHTPISTGLVPKE